MRVWTEGGRARGLVRVDSNGEVAFQAESRDVAVRMLRLVQRHSSSYGGRLKATVDFDDDETCAALLQAGFVEHRTLRFFTFRP